MASVNKKLKNKPETIIIRESNFNIFSSLLGITTKIISSIYNNLLIYIIIFLLFIIAFGSFVKIPLDILLNYIYLPEFLQNFISLFQTKEIPNAVQVIAHVNTTTLENTIKEVVAVQNNMLHLLEKQNETIIALQKSIETLSVQQNTNVGLNKVLDQIKVTNSLTQELINVNKATAKLYRAAHDSAIIKFTNFEQNISTILGNLQKDIINVLNTTHKDNINLLQNNNILLKSIQDQSINLYALNRDILAAINASTELQQAGFEALLQSSTNNHEYLTRLQDHQYLVENKLQQISKENAETAIRIKEEIVKSNKELEKSTAIGFIKDQISNIDIKINKENINKGN